MTFQSVEYLIFLPIVFLLYWTICRKSKDRQNVLIVIASLVFYAWCDWRCLGLLLITALSTYVAGGLIAKTENNNRRRTLLIGTLMLNLGVLFFFKYFNFFVQAFAGSLSLFGADIQTSTLKIILPVGISFYTFTALSYTIDVYLRKIERTRDILAYLAYVMFFPSILSGPISRAQKQLPQYFQQRYFNYDTVVSACKTAIGGGGNEIMRSRPSRHLCGCRIWKYRSA